jgi:hypothetical protein
MAIRNKSFRIDYDFFNRNDIKIIESEIGANGVLLYIKLLSMTMGGDGTIKSEHLELIKYISIITNTEESIIRNSMPLFEKYRLAKCFNERELYIVALRENTDRVSKEYIAWRKSIFERDNYTCQMCGERGKELNAHHIKKWSECIELRTDINNGITLCKLCHKELHKKERHING